ncbi:MAG: pimeloyl-ACP methyl ester esterase BioH [Thalassotalea sp.]
MTHKLNISSQGTGVPLVFIHGWGVNSAVWQPILDSFSADYEVITVDLPGFAKNQDIELSTYSVAAIAQLITDTITKPAVYVGWSLGGLVATEIALSVPKQVQGLVTVASSPHFVAQANWPGIDAEVLKGFHQQLAQNPEKTIKGFLKIQAMGSPNIRADIKLVSDLVMQYAMPSQLTLDKSLSLLESADYRSQLAAIEQPFLRLYGRLDGLVPKKVIAQIDLLAPKSQSFTFQQASHAPFISQPKAFSEQLQNWLNSL